MDGKQTDTVETASETPEKLKGQFVNTIPCPDCGRALSQQSRKCYYCGEADQETLKNVKLAMLDFQQEAALDSDGRASQSARKNLSILFIMTAGAVMGVGITGMASTYYSMLSIVPIGVILGVIGSIFYLNSLVLLVAALCQTFNMFFFASLGIKFLPKFFFKAGVCGFISSLSFLAVAIITYRIIKNKAIEL